MNNWTLKCEEYLHDRGYHGGRLLPIGKYFSKAGNLYALINNEKEGTHKLAIRHLEDLANRDF